MGLSYYADNLVVSALLNGVNLTAPTTLYLALYTSDPTAADSGTEISGFSYARQAITFGSPTNGTVESTNNIVFPTATGTWGTITYAAIRDAITAGNLLISGALASSKSISFGDILLFNAGNVACVIS